jgi:hypothetical protein
MEYLSEQIIGQCLYFFVLMNTLFNIDKLKDILGSGDFGTV